MNSEGRLNAIRDAMAAGGLDLLVGVHDGRHFIETPNPVLVLAGFKSLGPCAALLHRDGSRTLIVSPRWDAARAAEECSGLRVVPTDDLAGALAAVAAKGAVGIAGFPFMGSGDVTRIRDALPGGRPADDLLWGCSRAKTDDEIANAREATRIAELGYKHLLDIAKRGMSEDALALAVRQHSKLLGAEDNFLLLCAGAEPKAVQPSTGRKLQQGDLLLAEITPSYRGQLAQICRTMVIGTPSNALADQYDLLVRGMNAGIAAAKPGATMADVCRAINVVLEREGYGEYCHPPHIRRRGHGLGFGAIEPGDVALDNDTVLEPGMVFMIHPNQFLPGAGYLLCGEPVVITPGGAQVLSAEQSALAAIKR